MELKVGVRRVDRGRARGGKMRDVEELSDVGAAVLGVCVCVCVCVVS